ncbi:hypothetical protein AB0B30_09830 [Streptomyces narbonensis]|uniref:Uncharacterized protein n=1 Tax=Streptomyces narbonensis TaxID=67333 RepID=A0ABV3C4M6_9ACTN
MRVYVPLTLPGLAQVHTAGELAPGPVAAYAVTPALREWYASEDVEELEYAALGRAAEASLRLIAGHAGAPRCRVVLAVDVADKDVADSGSDGSVGEVRITGPVPLAKAGAVHADADDAVADVTAAAGALEAADRGDDEARSVVDGAEDHELLWFGVQEIPELLRR